MNRPSLFKKLLLALPLGLLGLAAQAPAQNLIVNGGFESPPVGTGWNVFASISGWTAVGTYGMEIGYFGLYGISGQGGTQVCELDGHGNAHIRQSVATTVGDRYRLAFSTAKRGGTDDSSNKITALIDGSPLVVIDPTWTVMQQDAFSFKATSSSTNVDFVGGGTQDSLGSMLDDVSMMLLTYDLCLLYDQAKLHKSGSTIPIKLQLCEDGMNVSSSSLVVHALEVVKIGAADAGVPEDSGNANPDSDFRYDATLGDTGGYIFNLSTKGLTAGEYVLRFKVDTESTVYEVGFQIK